MIVRTYDIKYAWLAKKYLHPEHLIHCELCGWYPRNGVYGCNLVCCNVVSYTTTYQSTLF